MTSNIQWEYFEMGQLRPLFVYFRSFRTHILQKYVGDSGIQTQIVGVEGKHADHLTTTTTANESILFQHCIVITVLKFAYLINSWSELSCDSICL